MLEIMSRFLIHAPHGLFFTIPANQAMYYAPADPANVSEQLRSMATSSYLPIISARRQSPDIVLSRDIFYYSPEGTYETITQGGQSEPPGVLHKSAHRCRNPPHLHRAVPLPLSRFPAAIRVALVARPTRGTH